MRLLRLALALAVSPLAGCQSMFPREDDPALALLQPQAAEAVNAGQGEAVSAQRLGPDGYPLLGAYPQAAAPQLQDQDVASERDRMQAAAEAQAAVSGSSSYDQSLAELRAVAAEQRREAEAAPTGADELQRLARARAEEALREIEGR